MSLRSGVEGSQADETTDASESIELQQARYEQLAALEEENAELSEQLGDQIIKTEEWYSKTEAATEEIDLKSQLDNQVVAEEIKRLQLQSRPPAVGPREAIALLQQAMLLKANAGGAIKREIEKALLLLTQ